MNSEGFYNFLAAHSKFAGYKDNDEYWENMQPIKVVDSMKVPFLVLSSKDDPIVLKEWIAKDLFLKNNRSLLVETKLGSHCAFSEGLFSSSSYSTRVLIDFIDTARKLQFTKMLI